MPRDVNIGPRLRAARLAQGLTLEAVATAAGISTGFVSKLERDLVSPSVASLLAVCAVVGVRMGELFEPPPSAIVRRGDGTRINFGGTDVVEHVLTSSAQSRVQVIHSVIEAGGSGGEALYTLESEVEFVYVLRGALTVVLGEERHELAQGDAMTFRARDPHTWLNPSDHDAAEVLWVLAPMV